MYKIQFIILIINKSGGNFMSEENTCNSSCGQIQIADEVLAIIAATAATEVEGVRTVSQEHLSQL